MWLAILPLAEVRDRARLERAIPGDGDRPVQSLRAQEAPRVEILSFAPRLEKLAGQDYIFVRGLLINRGPGPAAGIQVDLRAFGEDPDSPIAQGGGVSMLDGLDSGASGPFSVALRYCCPDEVRDYRFSVQARAAAEPPYRALQVENVHQIEEAEGPVISGELLNGGQAVLLAPSIDVHAGFFSGQDLVALRTARMPIHYNASEPTGQSHPPGLRYPWQIALPDLDYDRYELWTNGDAYPDGLFPVPLGFDVRSRRRDGADILVSGWLRHCGQQDSEAALLMLSGKDDRGRVRDLRLLALVAQDAIPPGDRGWLEARWPDASPAVDLGRVELTPLSLSVQARRPAALPCAPMSHLGLLPLALLRAPAETATATASPTGP